MLVEPSQLPLESGTIFQGDVLQRLKRIPSSKINCVVTSPPYFAVRDYGIDGQWGLEKDVWMYLDRLSELMKSLWRVLRNDGIVWVNLGDSIVNEGWFGFPEFFFTNCRRSGWRSVSKPIWWKRNAMPSSTQKRLTPRYENIYGFAKTDDYYFNLDPIRVPLTSVKTQPYNLRVREAKKGKLSKKYGTKYTASKEEIESHDTSGVKKQDVTIGGDGKVKANYKGFNGRWKKTLSQLESPADRGQRVKGIHRNRSAGDYGPGNEYQVNLKGKNPGDILDITVKPFPEAHFATFPPDIPEFFIKCSCPEDGWVLDPFMGSGTVGLVAQRLKRNWIGIDLKEEYIELAKRRISLG